MQSHPASRTTHEEPDEQFPESPQEIVQTPPGVWGPSWQRRNSHSLPFMQGPPTYGLSLPASPGGLPLSPQPAAMSSPARTAKIGVKRVMAGEGRSSETDEPAAGGSLLLHSCHLLSIRTEGQFAPKLATASRNAWGTGILLRVDGSTQTLTSVAFARTSPASFRITNELVMLVVPIFETWTSI